MEARRPLTYRDGIGTGVAVLAIAAACYLAAATLELQPMYAQFGDVALPGITRLVQNPVWLYGVPLALIAAIIVAHVWRLRHALIAIAALATPSTCSGTSPRGRRSTTSPV